MPSIPQHLILLLPLLILTYHPSQTLAARHSRPSTSSRCGSDIPFTRPRGVIQTPNFPADYDTTKGCEWIIDATDVDGLPGGHNRTIVVYLTQMYMQDGLTFTEYSAYDRNNRQYQSVGRSVYNVTKASVPFLQSFENVLVIRLDLSLFTDLHIRIMDTPPLLDVFGFNITYEITREGVRNHTCTMASCGYTGYCRDNYKNFFCECLDGFDGPSCSEGNKSACHINGSPRCMNGGICTHAGMNAIKCKCTPEYVGAQCNIWKDEVDTKQSEYNECGQKLSCPFDYKLQNFCNCGKSSPVTKRKTSTDLVIFFGNFIVEKVTNFSINGDNNSTSLNEYLQKQIFSYFNFYYRKIFNVTVTDISEDGGSLSVDYHFSAPQRDESQLKDDVLRAKQRGFFANLTLIDKQIGLSLATPLKLQSLSINIHQNTVREGHEFILSCTARGSHNMAFRWFKDGMFVNITKATTTKQMRLIQKSDGSEEYTALLIVERASMLDDGCFTCQVEDFGYQECHSTWVLVKLPLPVYMHPLSLSVLKGESFNIKCDSLVTNYDALMNYTFNWTKDGKLVAMTKFEYYEDLYPRGNHLQVKSGINKTTNYSCRVQDNNDGMSTATTSIVVTVIDQNLPPCSGHHNYNNNNKNNKRYKTLTTTQSPILTTMLFDTNTVTILPATTVITTQRTGQKGGKRKDKGNKDNKSLVVKVGSGDGHTGKPMQYHENHRIVEKWPIAAQNTLSMRQCPPGYTGKASRKCKAVTVMTGERNVAARSKWATMDYSGCVPNELNGTLQSFELLVLGYSQYNKSILDIVTNYHKYVASKDKDKKHLLSGEGYRILQLLADVILYVKHSRNYENIVAITRTILATVNEILNHHNAVFAEEHFKTLQEIVKDVLFLCGEHSADEMNEEYTHFVVEILYHDDDEQYNLYPSENATGEKTDNRMITVQYFNLTKELPRSTSIRSSDGIDLEYHIASDLKSAWILKHPQITDDNGSTVGRYVTVIVPYRYPLTNSQSNHITTSSTRPLLTLDGIGETSSDSSSSSVLTSRKKNWQLRCVVSDYGRNWEISVCDTGYVTGGKTVRCSCARDGTFAVIRVNEPNTNIPIVEPIKNNLFLILYTISVFISSSAGFVITFHWLRNKTTIIFLKLQCCFSLSSLATLFAIGDYLNYPQEYFLYIISILQILFFCAVSSQLSVLLITYSEIVDVARREGVRLTIVGIFTGAPVLAVFGNHLAHKALYLKLDTWWLIVGTLSFNSFIICLTTIVLLFILLYWILLDIIRRESSFGSRFIYQKYETIKRSAYVFTSLIVNIIASIIFINNQDNHDCHYALISTFIFTGIVIMIAFIPEFIVKRRLFSNMKFHRTATDDPSKPSLKSSTKEASAINYHLSKSKSTSVISPHNPNTHVSCKFRQLRPLSSEYPHETVEHNSCVSVYNNTANSPDILSSKVFAELDLVASSLRTTSGKYSASSPQICREMATPKHEAVNPIVAPLSQENRVLVMTSDISTTTSNAGANTNCTPLKTSDGLNLDDVINSISQDLEYLLNGQLEFTSEKDHL